MTSKLTLEQCQTASREGPGSSFGQNSNRVATSLGRARTWWWGPLLSQSQGCVVRYFASAALKLTALAAPTCSWSGQAWYGGRYGFPVGVDAVYEGEGKTAS
jgi:hypothetical protein